MMLRIKDYTTKVGSGVTPRGGAETYLDEGIPLFRSQNVTNDGFLMDDIAFISEEVDESMKGTRVKPGDVLLNITGASIGRCYYTSDDFECGNVNQHVCIIRPKKNKVKSEYLHYCIISDMGQQQIDLTQTGANREGLAVEDIKGFTFNIPFLSEQQRIVDYLDEKLAKISSRIEVLERQQNAYLRLKKSIIHQAVTRGLNPNVSLKDSSIEWIGMVPEHWERNRIKDVVSLRNEKTSDTSPKYIALENIVSWDATFIESNAETEGINNIFKSGDILFGKLRPYLAKGFIPDYDGICSTEFFVMCAKHGVSSLFVRYYILSQRVIDYIKHKVAGVKMPRTNWNEFGSIPLFLPPLSEQQTIVNYLDEKCAKIDSAIENIVKQIDASKRLKRALINEVITGQRAV